MREKVICNMANDERCVGCEHDELHAVREDFRGTKCTQWGECYDQNGEFLFKVRCVKVKEKDSV